MPRSIDAYSTLLGPSELQVTKHQAPRPCHFPVGVHADSVPDSVNFDVLTFSDSDGGRSSTITLQINKAAAHSALDVLHAAAHVNVAVEASPLASIGRADERRVGIN